MSGPAQNPESLERGLLRPAVDAKIFSAYQLTAGRGKDSFSLAGGQTSYWPGAEKVDVHTLFDIGSVTKAVVTTTLVGIALDEKKITLDRKFRGFPLSALLSHSAGLIPWLALYKESEVPHSPAELEAWFEKNEARCLSSDRAPAYSDLGFWLLGLCLEEVYQEPLASLFEKRIAKPLGLTRTAYGIGTTKPEHVAATEFCLWRKRVLQGTVFDENAAALGFPAGHAGLFSTADDLAIWARSWLDGTLVTPATRTLLSTRVSPRTTWALGWDTRSPEKSSAGSRFSEKSFGHLGYPGCSVWIDPVHRVWAVFLTNRIHPSRVDERIRDVRPVVHDAVHAYWMERNPA